MLFILFRIVWWPSAGKELSSGFDCNVSCMAKSLCILTNLRKGGVTTFTPCHIMQIAYFVLNMNVYSQAKVFGRERANIRL